MKHKETMKHNSVDVQGAVWTQPVSQAPKTKGDKKFPGFEAPEEQKTMTRISPRPINVFLGKRRDTDRRDEPCSHHEPKGTLLKQVRLT